MTRFSNLFIIINICQNKGGLSITADDFYRNESVLEGYAVNAPLIKNNLTCKVEGYEFKGWYVLGDSDKTLIDLETYAIQSNITLVALFGLIEE